MDRIRKLRNTSHKHLKLPKEHHTMSRALTLGGGATGAADRDSVAGDRDCRRNRWQEGAILTCRGGAHAAGHTEKCTLAYV